MYARIALLVIFLSCSGTKKETREDAEDNSPQWQVRILQNSDSSFGYEILQNGQTLIHQPIIPAVSGNRGFGSALQAQKVGTYLIEKLKKNIMPPTLTEEELDSLGTL